MKDLSKVFFNTVEEMNECYGIDAKLPSNLHSNADLVCYKIVEPYCFIYVGQYVFTADGFTHLDEAGLPCMSSASVGVYDEYGVHLDDTEEYGHKCFVYIRVNDHLRKHLEEILLGCEFIHRNDKGGTPFRRFVHSVGIRNSRVNIIDQDGLSSFLTHQLFYFDDYSDPIPYQEWVKLINKQDVGAEG